MRIVAVLAAILLLPASVAWAHGMDDHIPDARELADLEAKAAVAAPSEQPYLYAELVHSMTVIATAEYQEGDTRMASQSLKSAQSYAGKIQMNLAHDAHKLKDAEIIIRHTAFRLHELLTGANMNDRPTLEDTITQLNRVQTELMMQVFQK
ncbi:MAG TPA: hypothetical protein VHX60_14000 [Acidobacteriaceae bacterium]|jgi:hypothetical protein|nr:hypothetical protein [Acidobacteriaceae bacterium]